MLVATLYQLQELTFELATGLAAFFLLELSTGVLGVDSFSLVAGIQEVLANLGLGDALRNAVSRTASSSA